jgi:predicted esterase
MPALLSCLAACAEDEGADANANANATPTVTLDPAYEVVVESDLVYAEGLAHDQTSTAPRAIPLLLDVYAPDTDASNRPLFLFVHGGGFTGGTKTKPEIEAMGAYYASRGWVFVSVDYRTTEALGTLVDMNEDEVIAYYTGIAPREWIEHAMVPLAAGDLTPKQFQQSLAMYTAQRDAKAALRWMVAHASDYGIDTDFITVGGASAGAITAITLGISEQADFRDEIPAEDDPTLSTTNLDERYAVRSMVYFWGSTVKLDLSAAIYGVDPYDADDPALFMAHGTVDQNPSTPYSEATELQGIYDGLGIDHELVPLEGAGHGAWDAEVDGQGLSELAFDFVVASQGLNVEG